MGAASFPSGTATLGGPDIPTTAGFYQVTFNLDTGDYSFDIPAVGLVGPAISQWPGGSNQTPDVMMNSTDGNIYTLDFQILQDGELKFRQNQNWNVNWGSPDFPSGTLVQGSSDNIPAIGGIYDITFDRKSSTFDFQPSAAARVQVIHNSADPAAQFVDVYLEGNLLIDDFEFRTSTAFVDVPAGTPLEIDIAPGSSSDVSESLYNLTTTLTSGETYILVADGVLDTSQFDSSVNTIDFNLEVYPGARETSLNSGQTSILVHHGSTDAPTVDARETSVPLGIIVNDISYSDFGGYLDTATEDYIIDVELADNSGVVESYRAPLQTFGLGDLAITVVASGFLDPSANQNGAEFGLWVALPSGGNLVELPLNRTASLQVIHNSADPAAEFVDVYLDGDLILDDFEFRTATAFLEVPAELPIDIDVAPASSTDVSESIFNLNTTLAEDETYIAVADGVLDPSQFDSSVNAIDFNLEVYAGAQLASTNVGETSILVHHGSTDAPMVDVRETGVPAGIIVDDIAYTDFRGYLNLATQDYILDVELADNSAVVESYQAPLQTLGLGDLAITVLASGFLDPSANQNGAAFGLWVALPSGGALVELPLQTLSSENFEASSFTYYPNPVKNMLSISTTSTVENIKVHNLLGQLVKETAPKSSNPKVNLSEFDSGVYLVSLEVDGSIRTFKIIRQ
ncbi:DUF4397 domain-containing protein [Psychroflexus sediminis]|uniref:Por secretion system C-terminal sorting domain-containing protein n=1 Tax=Psychroflexus sediminis TaxID=470826 RepID=A0A1G7VQ01_9FLAO|nr:DUF4397 domain-containing protein [Psychroflexus sediminis]SDG61843.1 Por secretion system C-terminal sorting domain-containing protein [Psychroflexus sediminis]